MDTDYESAVDALEIEANRLDAEHASKEEAKLSEEEKSSHFRMWSFLPSAEQRQARSLRDAAVWLWESQHQHWYNPRLEGPLTALSDGTATPPYFTCMSSPASATDQTRWISHDVYGDGCCEFMSGIEARTCVKRWNERGGQFVTCEWIAPQEDSDDSNRGTYIIRLTGTRYEQRIWCGWHSQEVAGEKLKVLRNTLVMHGFETMRDILLASK